MRIESVALAALSAVGGGNLSRRPIPSCDPWLMMLALPAHHYAFHVIIPIAVGYISELPTIVDYNHHR